MPLPAHCLFFFLLTGRRRGRLSLYLSQSFIYKRERPLSFSVFTYIYRERGCHFPEKARRQAGRGKWCREQAAVHMLGRPGSPGMPAQRPPPLLPPPQTTNQHRRSRQRRMAGEGRQGQLHGGGRQVCPPPPPTKKACHGMEGGGGCLLRLQPRHGNAPLCLSAFHICLALSSAFLLFAR